MTTDVMSCDSVLRDSTVETDRRSHVKMEAEMGGIQPQVKGFLEPKRLEGAGGTLP